MSTQNGFALDTSRWPLVIVEPPRRAVTDAEIDEFLAAQRAMLRRRERYVEVADTAGIRILPPSQRKKLADFLRETNPVANQLCAGLAIVVENPMIRGAMTAIFWIFQPSYPIKAAGSFAEAAGFLREAARTSGLALPPAAIEYLDRSEARRSA